MCISFTGLSGNLPEVSTTSVAQTDLSLPTECSGGHELNLVPSKGDFDDDSVSWYRRGKLLQEKVQGKHIPKPPMETLPTKGGNPMLSQQQKAKHVNQGNCPSYYSTAQNRPLGDARPLSLRAGNDAAAKPLQTAITHTAFGARGDNTKHPFQACGMLSPHVLAKTLSGLADVQRGPADRAIPTTALQNPTTTTCPPCTQFKSPVIIDDDYGAAGHGAVYTFAGTPSKTQVINVSDHPSQSASVEDGNLAKECHSDESDCDNWSYISGSTRVSQKKTGGRSFEMPPHRLVMPAPHSGNPEPVSETSLKHGVECTTTSSVLEPKMKTPSLGLPPAPSTVATNSKGGRHDYASTAVFTPHSVPKPALSAISKQVTTVAVNKPSSEPAATLEYYNSPPRPDSVIDPLDSSSRELIEMVCSTVNSKWPILARYLCLPEDSIASIKEQDTEAEGRCWVLLLRLCNKGITWKALYDVLLSMVSVEEACLSAIFITSSLSLHIHMSTLKYCVTCQIHFHR